MRTFRYVVADVFTDTPLTGNQLAVFTDARELADDEMQSLAREMKFSESVFVFRRRTTVTCGSGSSRRPTRCCLPGTRRSGSAFVLGGPLQVEEIRLETGAGTVPVALEREGDRIVFGRMRQPIPTWKPWTTRRGCWRPSASSAPSSRSSTTTTGMHHVYVALGSEEEVAALKPDLAALADGPALLGINCFAGSGAHWKTRMFAPGGGVPEDPATGSAAGPLAVHLARHGRIGFGEEIEVSQGAEIGRPSTLYARADGSAEKLERVEVGGSAVIVARGEFRLP